MLLNIIKKRIRLRNGYDLDNPVILPSITERDRTLYITRTLPKIEELLIAKYGKRKVPNEAKPKSSIYGPKKTSTEITIFKHIKEYTKEEILSIIPDLSPIDKKRLEQMNGSDLDNPVHQEKISQKIIISYITRTIPNIKRLLKNKYGKRTTSKDNVQKQKK